VKTILVHPSPFEFSFHHAKAGAVFILNIHQLKWSVELRTRPPSIRLLEDGRQGEPTLCEIVGDWPDAPRYWPEEWEPGRDAPHNPRPVPARAGWAR